MRRSAIALGASVLALALGAGPATAADALQTADGSTGAAQVGSVDVDAPVRVLSDGDDAAGSGSGSSGAPQSADESAGAAQVGSVDADAPVRVASDGDGTTDATTSGGDQTTGDSTGAAQAGPADVDAPVRVLSDGDDAAGAGSGSSGAPQSADESAGAAQVGSVDADAPVRVLSDGDTTTDGSGGSAAGEQSVSDSDGAAQVGSPTVSAPITALQDVDADDLPGRTLPEEVGDVVDGVLSAVPSGGGDGGGGDTPVDDLVDAVIGFLPGNGGGGEVVTSPSATPSGAGDDTPSPEELRRLVDGSDPDPQLEFAAGTSGADSPGFEPAVDLQGAVGGDLPLTGFALIAAMVLVGLWLLSAGSVLRSLPSQD